MKFEINKKYDVTFDVEYFEDTEGGMVTDSFGDTVGTLREAIELLEMARIKEKGVNWIITCSASITYNREN